LKPEDGAVNLTASPMSNEPNTSNEENKVKLVSEKFKSLPVSVFNCSCVESAPLAEMHNTAQHRPENNSMLLFK
jgi:hypothetical protein